MGWSTLLIIYMHAREFSQIQNIFNYLINLTLSISSWHLVKRIYDISMQGVRVLCNKQNKKKVCVRNILVEVLKNLIMRHG